MALALRYEDPWLKEAIEVGWIQAIKEAIRQRGLYPNGNPCPPQPATTLEQKHRVARALENVFGLLPAAPL